MQRRFKCVFSSCQNAAQNPKRAFESMERYLRITVTSQNYIHDVVSMITLRRMR
jgi:hypothetical protein